MRALQKVLYMFTVIFLLISILTDYSSARKPRRTGHNRKDKNGNQNNGRDNLNVEGGVFQLGINETVVSSDLNANKRRLNANERDPSDQLYYDEFEEDDDVDNFEESENDEQLHHVVNEKNITTTGISNPTVGPRTRNYRQMKRDHRLEMIRQQILNGLHMTREPHIRDNEYTEKMKQEIKDKIKWQNSFFEGTPEVTRKIFQALQPACKVPHKSDQTWDDPDKFRLYFEIDKKQLHEEKNTTISSATLRIFKHPLKAGNCDKDPKYIRGQRARMQHKQQRHKRHMDDAEDNNLRITVYQYYKPIKGGRNDDKKRIISTEVVSKDYNGWVKLDLKEAFKSWLDKPKKNFGISIVTEDSAGEIHPDRIFTRRNCSQSEINSFLVLPVSLALLDGQSQNASHLAGYNSSLPSLDILSTESSPKKVSPVRQKRYSGKRNQGWKKPSCGIHETYVTFEELDWTDWIIQPKGFQYRTCKGTCSRLPRGNRYLKKKVSPNGKNSYKPADHSCCGPTKLKPLRMIHFNEKQTIMLSIFDDFIITECGCRP